MYFLFTFFFFFFSSRRRHTRFDCDWSSDVCSSDLASASSALISALLLPAALPAARILLISSSSFFSLLRFSNRSCSNSLAALAWSGSMRSEEHTSELQSQSNLVCRLLLEKKKKKSY